MDKEILGKIYDILMQFTGARIESREGFIYHHSLEKYPCTEWRFQGKLGFGGKYRIGRNVVDYYPEDKTPERELITKTTNEELAKINILCY